MRLIDADALLAFEKFDRELTGEKHTSKDFLMMIKTAPTIDPESLRPKGKWEIGRMLDRLYCRIYGGNEEFEDRMAGYNSSSFCAGFEYAILLAKGLLSQLPEPPNCGADMRGEGE